MMKLIPDLQWAGDRLREASTYAGLGLILGAAFALLHVPTADVPAVVKDVMSIGMGLGGLVAVVLPEGK